MQQLLTLLVIISCSSTALASWRYGITFSDDNCTTPVAIELVQIPACPTKRAVEFLGCSMLYGDSHLWYTSNCVDTKPTAPEFSVLPVIVMKYPSTDNCTANDDAVVYFLAKNYTGLMVTGALGGGHGESTVNVECSDAGVLSASICENSCLVNSTIPEDQCVFSEYSITQTGCSAVVPPTAVPMAVDAPTGESTPQAQVPHSTPVSAPKAKTSSAGTAAFFGVVIVTVCSLLF